MSVQGVKDYIKKESQMPHSGYNERVDSHINYTAYYHAQNTAEKLTRIRNKGFSYWQA